MKELWILALFILAVSAIAIDRVHKHGENGWYVPQQNGSLVWMDFKETQKELAIARQSQMGRSWSLNPVNFYLYTKKNPEQKQKITTDSKSIKVSNFNPNNPTRISIHGWIDGLNSKINKKVRNAWFKKGDYNIICVSWLRSRGLDYISAVSAVEGVGKKIASLIDFLVQNHGMSLDTLQVIGHSLGAHIAGYAGKNTKTGQIHTIIGLDPALPLFKDNNPKNRLATTDAFYVEVIHTNAGLLGFLTPIGKSDFYPNGGKNQPGCGWDLFGKCAHLLAIDYYAEAVEHESFPSIKCENYELAINKECRLVYSDINMAAPNNAYHVNGLFYVPVNSNYPYGVRS